VSQDGLYKTRYCAWVQEAQEAQEAEPTLGDSGCNTTVSDAGPVWADVHQSGGPIFA